MGFDNLPPWEAFWHFDAPKAALYDFAVASPVQIALPDTQRVLIVAGLTGTGQGANLGINESGLAVSVGWFIQPSNQPLVISHAQWGPLVQHQSWVSGGAGNILYVVLVNLRDWPLREDMVQDER